MASWDEVECVFIEAVACPHCGSTKPITVRSEQNGDGSVTRKSICRRCSRRFKVVVEISEFELPPFGKAVFSPDRI